MIGFLNKMEICGMIRIISSPLHKQNSFILHFIHGSITVKFGRGGSQLPFSEWHICNSACKTWADMPLAAVWAVQLPTQTQFLWRYMEPQPLRPPLRPRALECFFFFSELFLNSCLLTNKEPVPTYITTYQASLKIKSKSIPVLSKSIPVFRWNKPCSCSSHNLFLWGFKNTGSPLQYCVNSKSLCRSKVCNTT